jgi:uncharacterized protein YdbL (DUF1318 family)
MSIVVQEDFFDFEDIQIRLYPTEQIPSNGNAQRERIEYQKITQENWAIVAKHQAQAEQKLLARIRDKREEVQSLRDGVKP